MLPSGSARTAFHAVFGTAVVGRSTIALGLGDSVVERCGMHIVHPASRARDGAIRQPTDQTALRHRSGLDPPVVHAWRPFEPPAEQLAIELGQRRRLRASQQTGLTGASDIVQRGSRHQAQRDTVYHWARVARQHDPTSKSRYAALRQRGQPLNQRRLNCRSRPRTGFVA